MKIEELIEFFKTKSLLYIEDDENLKNNNLLIFHEFFNEVFYLNSGEHFLDMINSNTIDLIITDLIMYQFDGYYIINNNIQNIPIVITTAINDQNQELLNNQNVIDILNKPFHLENFLDTLQKLKSYDEK